MLGKRKNSKNTTSTLLAFIQEAVVYTHLWKSDLNIGKFFLKWGMYNVLCMYHGLMSPNRSSLFYACRFVEMPTNRYVESSFWNFDALFVPQRHPARDSQDTFYISGLNNFLLIFFLVKSHVHMCVQCCRSSWVWSFTWKLHRESWQGTFSRRLWLLRVYSRWIHFVVFNVSNYLHGYIYDFNSYAYDWKESEARKNVLRTHTTPVSARMLHSLAQKVVNYHM